MPRDYPTILDLVGEEKVVGKTLGIDLEKQKLTLPIIHFLECAPAEHGALLRSLLQSRESDKLERIRNLILPSGSVQYARTRAARTIAVVCAAPSSRADDNRYGRIWRELSRAVNLL